MGDDAPLPSYAQAVSENRSKSEGSSISRLDVNLLQKIESFPAGPISWHFRRVFAQKSPVVYYACAESTMKL